MTSGSDESKSRAGALLQDANHSNRSCLNHLKQSIPTSARRRPGLKAKIFSGDGTIAA
jgi:hypothetical protein